MLLSLPDGLGIWFPALTQCASRRPAGQLNHIPATCAADHSRVMFRCGGHNPSPTWDMVFNSTVPQLYWNPVQCTLQCSPYTQGLSQATCWPNLTTFHGPNLFWLFAFPFIRLEVWALRAPNPWPQFAFTFKCNISFRSSNLPANDSLRTSTRFWGAPAPTYSSQRRDHFAKCCPWPSILPQPAITAISCIQEAKQLLLEMQQSFQQISLIRG